MTSLVPEKQTLLAVRCSWQVCWACWWPSELWGREGWVFRRVRARAMTCWAKRRSTCQEWCPLECQDAPSPSFALNITNNRSLIAVTSELRLNMFRHVFWVTCKEVGDSYREWRLSELFSDFRLNLSFAILLLVFRRFARTIPVLSVRCKNNTSSEPQKQASTISVQILYRLIQHKRSLAIL